MSELPALKQIIEGAILAADQPLSIDNMISLFEGEQPSRADLRDVLTEIETDCEGRGFQLKEVASGYRFQVREEYGDWVGRLWEERPPRYTRALLETLALIAYKQPITRGDIEEIRGVAVSTNIIRTLLEREWIRVVGHRDVPGRPAIYATTKTFLDYFNLTSLDELPTLSEIKDLDKLNEELNLDDEIIEPRSLEFKMEEGEEVDAEETDLDEVTNQVNTIQENIRKALIEEEPEEDDWDDDDEGDGSPRAEAESAAEESAEESAEEPVEAAGAEPEAAENEDEIESRSEEPEATAEADESEQQDASEETPTPESPEGEGEQPDNERGA